MIARALFYYQSHSWLNRLRERIRRLRQPKYLFGAIVGGLYFYWYIFRALGRSGRGMPVTWGHEAMAEQIGAAILFVVILAAWIFPDSRAAVSFSEAEVAFLFPAPVTRKELIHFKLLKMQAVILFSAVFMMLIGRTWTAGSPIFRLAGWWVILSAINLHLIGSSFARTALLDRGYSNWLRRGIVLGLVALLVGGTAFWVYSTAPPLSTLAAPGTDIHTIARYAHQVLREGPLNYVLCPFRLVVAPYFAATTGQFFSALVPALSILVLLYWWVVRSDVAFEEASLELSKRTAERLAAVRSGNWQAARKPKKASRDPFRLQPTGFPALALLWKNLVSAGHLVTTRVWLFLIWLVVFGSIGFNAGGRHTGNAGEALAFCALMLAGVSLFWGPQVLRNDLRQDLPITDILKMYPLPGWQVVLGQVLAPVSILAALQWLLLLLSLFLLPSHVFNLATTSFSQRAGVALGAAIMLPCVDLMALIIPNAAVLFFPAWFQLGKDGPRGFETTGQQLILMFGQLLVLVLSLTPCAAAFAPVVYVTSHFLPFAVSVPLSCAVGALVLLIEAGFAIRFLGGVFERFDLSGELSHAG